MERVFKGTKLDADKQRRLETLSAIHDHPSHRLICAAIEFHAEHEDRCENEKREDAERWERYRLTREAVSHEITTAWLNRLAAGCLALAPVSK